MIGWFFSRNKRNAEIYVEIIRIIMQLLHAGGNKMHRYSINVSTVFTEYPFLDRFQKAKEAGFKFVECQFPYDYSIDDILEKLEEHNLTLVLINLPPGSWEKGDRGLAVDPTRIEEFKVSVENGISYASALGVRMVHCMAGIVSGQQDVRDTYIQNVRYAGEKLAEYGITMLIEPINPFDMPGYFLQNLQEAVQILDEIGLSNVKLQYDIYHMQRIHGNLISNLQLYFNKIGHIQIADVPGRGEPGTGEIHYENIFKAIHKQGYTGLIGLEYTPSGISSDSFGWIHNKGGTF